VIKFKCIYCGQRILAKDDGAGKKGKCPKCAHILTVPASTKGRPAISTNKEPMPDQPKPPYVPAWEHVSEWRERQNRMPEEQAEALAELCKESFGFLIPTYDMLSLLLMALTFILLFITNSQMRVFEPDANKVIPQTESLIYSAKLFMLIAIVPTFFMFRICSQTDADLKKQIMLFFAVMINAYSGIIAGIHVISNIADSNWLLIFPIWNIVNSLLMLSMFYMEVIDEECISDRKITLFRFCLGLIAILGIFFVCNYIFKLYWAITYSICIIYTTSFDRGLQSVFPGLTGQKYEQSSEG
jgi:DNA-directed RNA polymerase subunit RPC12/RpoP